MPMRGMMVETEHPTKHPAKHPAPGTCKTLGIAVKPSDMSRAVRLSAQWRDEHATVLSIIR